MVPKDASSTNSHLKKSWRDSGFKTTARVLSPVCPTRPRRQLHAYGRGACAASGAAPTGATHADRVLKPPACRSVAQDFSPAELSNQKIAFEHVDAVVFQVSILFTRELANANASVDSPGIQ